jgi:hypothetical protein
MRFFRRAQPPDPDPAFVAFLADHGLAAFERQAALTDLVGDRDWELDQERGVLTFGDDLSFPAQILGSEADRSKTWLWAWANPSVDEGMARSATACRRLGEERQIDVLTEPEFELSRIGEAYLLALAVVGALEADAYYPCPYPGGAAYVTVEVPGGLRQVGRSAAARAALVIAGAAEQAPAILSRMSIERYLAGLDATVDSTNDRLTVDDSTTFRFDDLGRLTAVEATIEEAPRRQGIRPP